jgi:glutamate-1-semialdehyde 2,1-aminomutase
MVDEYVERHPRSRELHIRAQTAFPGGDTRTVTYFGPFPVYVERGSGCRLYGADGHTLLDLLGNYTSIIWGHAHPRIVEAARAQLERGTGFAAPTESQAVLGGMLRERLPSMDQVRFANSGTEANMHAIRAARAFTGRDKIVKFAGCYHGHADSFLVKAGSGATTLGVPTSPGVARAVADTLLARYNDLAALETLCDAHGGAVAAVIVEPIAGNMGVVAPAEGFLAGLRTLTDRRGILLIFDEVISGFRASAGGAQSIFGVTPDLTCLGKIIGGGLPVGAYGGRADIMDMVAPAGPVYQAGTLSGNPLAMTAGLWALKRLTPRLYTDLARRGSMLAAGFADAARRAGVELQVNAFGSMVTPFFTSSPVRDYDSALNANTGAYATFFRGMLSRGVYPPPSQFEAWFLSAAHTDRHITQTIAAARAAMKDVAREI